MDVDKKYNPFVEPDLRVSQVPVDPDHSFSFDPFSGLITCDRNPEVYGFPARNREAAPPQFVVLIWRERRIAFNKGGAERLTDKLRKQFGIGFHDIAHVLDDVGYSPSFARRRGYTPRSDRPYIDIEDFSGFASSEEQNEFVTLACEVLRAYDFSYYPKNPTAPLRTAQVFISEKLQNELDRGDLIR